MDQKQITEALRHNAATFRSLLAGTDKPLHAFRYAPGKWNLLEIVCHLYDEEREDFRARVKHILENHDKPMPPIDPVAWVKDRDYASQNFDERLSLFLEERNQSVAWLHGLQNPPWDNAYIHPKAGPMTARFILANWLAHDYLHFRQITRNLYEFLKAGAGNVDYAGNW